MVTLLLDSLQLEVTLSASERAFARRSERLRIDRTHIAKVQVVDDPWPWLRGTPAPGTLLRGVLAMGTWHSAAGDDFVAVRRHRPAVIVDLEHEGYERLVLTTRHGAALAQALRLDGGDGEVTELGDD